MRSRPDVLRVGASTSGFRGVTTESNTLPLTPPSPVSGASRTCLQRLLERFVPHRAKRRVCRWAPGLLRPRTLCGFLSRNAGRFPCRPSPWGSGPRAAPLGRVGRGLGSSGTDDPSLCHLHSRAPFPAGVSALTGAPAAARSDQRGRRDGRCLGEGGGARAPLQLPGDEPRVQVHHPDVRKHHQ